MKPIWIMIGAELVDLTGYCSFLRVGETIEANHRVTGEKWIFQTSCKADAVCAFKAIRRALLKEA